MSQPGWYPDPGGAPGRYRYWNGTTWSAETSATAGASSTSPAAPSQPRRGGRARWIVGIAVIVVLAVGVVFGVNALSNRVGLEIKPGSDASVNQCPPMPTQAQSPAPDTSGGRVHAGGLSYPLLGSPWSPPAPEYRLAFGVDVFTQTVTDQANYDGKGHSWVASILIARLLASDGAVAPKTGVDIVVKCIVGTFYGDNPVQRQDKIYEAHPVDGHDGWLIESHLSFDIPGLKTKGELMIVLVVSTSTDTSAIFYASIPDTMPQLVAVAHDTMKALAVDS